MTVTHNPSSKHLKEETVPKVSANAFIHPQAYVCGDVHIGKDVFIAPFASVRADEGSPFYIGDFSNLQDGVVFHALETYEENGDKVKKNFIEVDGKDYAIYVGNFVSVAHQAQVHGPSFIDDETFVGMQAFVFRSRIGKRCVIEPGAKVMNVTVSDGRYVPAGMTLKKQKDADDLPVITDDYPLAGLNKDVVKVNRDLAHAYNKI